jgi:cation diffusion facilitator CzcD-associated flavoprotein CzcO
VTSVVRQDDCEVAVIGAGPYGLAIAAHLRAANVDTRIFGEAMAFWRRNMPKGMRLRSTWNATHISDPGRQHALDVYAAEWGLQRADMLPLQHFVGYGQWFQNRVVPDLDTRRVLRVAPTDAGFTLLIEGGGIVTARRVVVATGLANQDFRPAPLRDLPAELVSHACEHDDLAKFAGRRIAVVGRGQSACESAALLGEAGADVELICRGDIHWLGPQTPNAPPARDVYWRLHKMLEAPSGVGPFPLNWLNEMPAIVHRLPPALRRAVNAFSLRAGATAWLKPRLRGVRVNAGRQIVAARPAGDRLTLQLDNVARSFEHVLLATGYRVDIARTGLLGPEALARIACREGAPVLAAGLESTLPGLHFAGASAVKSFGPLMRFIAGSGFAASEVTRTVLARRARRDDREPVDGDGRAARAETVTLER